MITVNSIKSGSKNSGRVFDDWVELHQMLGDHYMSILKFTGLNSSVRR